MKALTLSVALFVLLGLAPGLSGSEHAELAHSGAFGSHPVKVLLLGDSIALTLGIGLAHDAKVNYGIDIDNKSTLGCDLDPSLEIITSGKPGPATPGCPEWRELWPFLTASVQPDVVVLGVGRWEVGDHFYDDQWVHIGDPLWDNHVAADLKQAIAIFNLFGAKVVLLTLPYLDPATRQPDGQPWPENSMEYISRFNQLTRQVAKSMPHEVTVIDLNKMLSPNGKYDTVVDGVRVRWSDGVHVSYAGGELLQRSILPTIDRIGLADERRVKVTGERLHQKVLAEQRALAAAARAKAERKHYAREQVRKQLDW
ncbi:MAG TPA: SGNH hydrolase domain-containing protein [Acidimicrobiales bacterium]|jgi:hypothetical protein